ncbi:methyltransferase domain-containing protein [Colletotrichum asianum]
MSASNDASATTAEGTAPAATTPSAASPTAQPPATGAQPTEEEQIVPDDEQPVDDAASDLGGSIASSRTSLSESIYNYRLENGRTYHRYKEGKYQYPNDDRELERLDLQHHMFDLCLDGKLGVAPPNDKDSGVHRVLDVGTGTGLWAIEFGEAHPEAEVLGVDLSPPQAEVPPNVIFEVDDIDEPWIYSRPFDYIHSRMMNSSISDWRQFIQKAYDNLTPGGYLELKEVDLMPESDDGTLPTDSALNKTYTLIGEALKVFGRPFQDVLPLVDMMKEVGFVDLYVKKFKWPTNTWPRDSHFKEIGEWANVNYLSGIEGWVMAPLTRALGWKKEEVQVLLIDVRKEFNDRNIHAYWSWYAIYGKKPEADTQ